MDIPIIYKIGSTVYPTLETAVSAALTKTPGLKIALGDLVNKLIKAGDAIAQSALGKAVSKADDGLNKGYAKVTEKLRLKGKNGAQENAERINKVEGKLPTFEKLDECLKNKLPLVAKGEWIPPKEALRKIPQELGQGKFNDNGSGFKWLDKPQGTKDYIRISQANPNAQFPSQEVDYVRITYQGKIIGKDGKAIVGGGKTSQTPEAHIPLSEWIKWAEWWRP